MTVAARTAAGETEGSVSPSHRAALGALINVAGRQRMLSHRAVMLLALSRIAPPEGRDALIGSAREAMEGFEAGRKRLVEGDSPHGAAMPVSPRVKAILEEASPGQGISGGRLLERFVLRGGGCLDRLAVHDREIEGEILALSRLVAEDLLALLNRIVAAFEADLAEAMQAEAERSASIRRVLDATLEDIEQLGSRINMIAFNALIEAARAGEAGRAFAIIAQEIKALSSQAREESAKMAEAVRKLFVDA